MGGIRRPPPSAGGRGRRTIINGINIWAKFYGPKLFFPKGTNLGPTEGHSKKSLFGDFGIEKSKKKKMKNFIGVNKFIKFHHFWHFDPSLDPFKL